MVRAELCDEEASVPPDRLMQTDSDLWKFSMVWIEKEVLLDASDDTRDDKEQ